ncbi:hypothetical protein [Clostridium sp.]|uniref:hypothetical protein n=1 Tax=Clostridium sp. TaxID=1506 RepID=UPI002FC6B751
MKKIIALMLVVFIVLAIPVVMYLQNVNKDYNCFQTRTEKTTKEVSEVFNSSQNTKEEEKRVKLYIAVMRDAFKIKNGGNRFIAIKKDALVGLDEKSKEKVLEGFKDLSPNLYWFEDIKDNEAVIEATSWYGNLGAVIPTYKAIYKNGQWELKNISTGVA